MSRRLIYLLLSLVVVAWGGAFVAIKIVVRHASALSAAELRFVLTTLGMLAVMAVVRPPLRRIDRGDWPRLLLISLCGVSIYHVSLNYGEHFISSNVAALIVASMPVLVAVLSGIVLKERLEATKWLGIGIALAGVTLLVLRGTPDAELSVRSIGGAAVTALAPLSWAVYTVASKPLVLKYGPLPMTTLAMGVGTLLLSPVALPKTLADVGRLTAGDWGWIAFLAFACSIYGYSVWFYALRVLPAAQVAASVYLVPPISLVWAAVVLGEPMTIFAAAGGALVLAGVILTERVAPRAAARREAERAPA